MIEAVEEGVGVGEWKVLWMTMLTLISKRRVTRVVLHLVAEVILEARSWVCYCHWYWPSPNQKGRWWWDLSRKSQTRSQMSQRCSRCPRPRCHHYRHLSQGMTVRTIVGSWVSGRFHQKRAILNEMMKWKKRARGLRGLSQKNVDGVEDKCALR